MHIRTCALLSTFRLSLAVALTLSAIAAMPFAVPVKGQPAAEQSLDAMLELLRRASGLPALAAAVARNGEIVAAGAVGTRVHGREIAVTIDDRFHIGSDAKAMTATLAGQLVDEGKLRFDSTIGEVLGKVLPGLDGGFSAITLEQLLSHTSGIPSDNKEIAALYFSPDAYDYDLPAYRLRMLGIFGKTASVPTNRAFRYSNLGYIAAGTMIEAAAGEPWESLVIRRIFAPLRLASAGLGPQATRGKIDAPIGHAVDDKGNITPHLWGPAADVPAAMGPAGVVHLSIRDFARWGAWNAAQGTRPPALVKPETVKSLHRAHVTMDIADPIPGTPKSGAYALGWGIVTFPWSDGPVLTHNGSNGMNLATILVDTRNDLAIVVTTNFPGDTADRVLLQATQMLYEQFGPKRGAP